MRRTPSTDSPFLPLTGGAAPGETLATGTAFDLAFRELASARAQYDRHLGDPESVPNLAVAAARLDAARRQMAALRTAA